MFIKYPLMALLRPGPRTAGQLRQEFNHATGDIWPLNMGQVSQTLTRLERDELTQPAGTTTGPTGRQAQLYELTDAGRQELQTWWTAPIDPAPVRHERDELVLKFLMADTAPGVNLIELLDAQRFANLRHLRELNATLRDLPETRNAARLNAEKRIVELEAQARWLDRVEALNSPQEPTS